MTKIYVIKKSVFSGRLSESWKGTKDSTSDGYMRGCQYQEEFWFGLVLWPTNHCWLFYGKSFKYIFIKYMISKHILYINFFNKPELIFLHTVKWFHLFLCNMNYCIYYQSLVRSLFNVFYVLLFNPSNSIKHQTFV